MEYCHELMNFYRLNNVPNNCIHCSFLMLKLSHPRSVGTSNWFLCIFIHNNLLGHFQRKRNLKNIMNFEMPKMNGNSLLLLLYLCMYVHVYICVHVYAQFFCMKVCVCAIYNYLSISFSSPKLLILQYTHFRNEDILLWKTYVFFETFNLQCFSLIIPYFLHAIFNLHTRC